MLAPLYSILRNKNKTLGTCVMPSMHAISGEAFFNSLAVGICRAIENPPQQMHRIPSCKSTHCSHPSLQILTSKEQLCVLSFLNSTDARAQRHFGTSKHSKKSHEVRQRRDRILFFSLFVIAQLDGKAHPPKKKQSSLTISSV